MSKDKIKKINVQSNELVENLYNQRCSPMTLKSFNQLSVQEQNALILFFGFGIEHICKLLDHKCNTIYRHTTNVNEDK